MSSGQDDLGVGERKKIPRFQTWESRYISGPFSEIERVLIFLVYLWTCCVWGPLGCADGWPDA